MRKTNVRTGRQSLNKGFTLIELLAVIVILAIIALIAVPIILNIINDSKESTTIRSAENYLKAVELAVANKNTKGKFNPNTCVMEGNIGTCTGEFDAVHCQGEPVCTAPELEVKVDGEVPTKATIMFENGTVADGTTLTIADSDFIKENNKLRVQKEEPIPTPVSFSQDSWDTIVKNVRAGNTDVYNVGATKSVELQGFDGTFTLRIANNSTPTECDNTNFSQTACGFVIEFSKIIIKKPMNSTNTNVGGWRDSYMRSYVNNEIYNALPLEIKENIIDTKVISSHGNTSGENNFTTTDKLYLFSSSEIWKNGTSNTIYSTNDTASRNTRQLDYYKNRAVTTDKYSGAKKRYDGELEEWWLRSAYDDYSDFFYVDDDGDWFDGSANYTKGVAPAFRIG